MDYVSAVSELNYMTQVVIMLYEDPTKDPYAEDRFHVELHFSPGVVCCVQKNLPPGPGFRPQTRSSSVISLFVLKFMFLTLMLYITFLEGSFKQYGESSFGNSA